MRWGWALLTVAVATATACRAPTQLTLDLSTDLACASSSGTTSVTVGPSFEALPDAPSASAATCGPADGEIGTLVLVPSGEKNAAVAIEVIAGVGREACAPAGRALDGCIVARRRIRFEPHAELRLPIVLRSRCAGVTCAAHDTCDPDGRCVSAECADPECSNLAAPRTADGGSVLDDARATPSPDGAGPDGAGSCAALTVGVDCASGTCTNGDLCCNGSTCFQQGGTCGSPLVHGIRACDETGDCPQGMVCCVSNGASGLQTTCATVCARAQACKRDCDCERSACQTTVFCDAPTCGGVGCGSAT